MGPLVSGTHDWTARALNSTRTRTPAFVCDACATLKSFTAILRYPPWTIAPTVNKTKLVAMAIATFASIDKFFIIFSDYSWSCAFAESSGFPARALSLFSNSRGGRLQDESYRSSETKACLVFVFLIGSNLGALADVRALTDIAGGARKRFGANIVLTRQ